jgi:hypothetical protein
MSRQKQVYNSLPKDLGVVGNVREFLASTPWAKIPTYYYDIFTRQLPMVEADFNSLFNSTVQVFSTELSTPGRQTNTETGSGVNEIFLAMGAGIVAIGADKAFSLPGAAVTPGALTADDDLAVPGCQAPGPDGANVLSPGQYWYGAPTWQIIDGFFRNTNLQVLANRRFLLVDESTEDVGMTPLPPEFIGASDSRIPAGPFIRRTNDHLLDITGDVQFLPQSVDVVDGASSCVPPADAGVTYGHPRITGLAQRIYPFCRPILFVPGMRFDVSLVPQGGDLCNVDLMRMAALVQSDTYSSLQANNVVGGVASNRFTVIPAGCISIGVVLKGVALWPSACIDYLADFFGDRGMLAGLYGANPYISGLLQKYGNEQKYASKVQHLSGLLAGAPRE